MSEMAVFLRIFDDVNSYVCATSELLEVDILVDIHLSTVNLHDAASSVLVGDR